MNRILLQILLFSFLSFAIQAQSWEIEVPSNVRSNGERLIQPSDYILAKIDDIDLKDRLWKSPQESSSSRSNSEVIGVMLRDGSMDEFRVVEYKMMEPQLAAKFSNVKTFIGYSKTNILRKIRIDYTGQGFRAVISDGTGKTYIDPYYKDNKELRIIYRKSDLEVKEDWTCSTESGKVDEWNPSSERFAGDCVLRTYRLACAANGEYTTFHGGAVADAHDAIVTTINRVNEIFEQDLSSRFILVANNDALIFTNSATDPYTNDDGFAMLDENQATVDMVIGFDNYDIGHVFSTDGGGVASLRSLCNPNQNVNFISKARGVTGQGAPVNDPFDIDYVAHEIGHQFGGNHTQNNSCQRSGASVEPGSASTIMGYAGICAPNVQGNSDAYFHAISIAEMTAHITGAGNCGTNVNLANSAPVVSALQNYTVPASSFLVLEAAAQDADAGDALTYCWEQMDPEVANMPPQSGSNQGPAFRSIYPSISPKRYLPNISAIVNNTTPTWEVLPSVSRTMNFRVTVRDHLEAVGCTDENDMVITVDGNSGPFLVTNASIPATVQEGQTVPLTWSVAGTDVAPVSCTNVDVYMSTDGGLTYGNTPILAGTANDGTADVVIPQGLTTTARLMIKCADNIFFDINDSNFEVEVGVDGFTMSLDPTSASECNDQDVTFLINTNAIGAFNTDINFTITGAPSGASIGFSQNPITPGNSTMVTLSNFGSNVGDFDLDIEGVAGAITRNNNFDLTLFEPTIAPSLVSPVDNAIDISTSPTLTWSATAFASSYDYVVSSSAGGGGDVALGNTLQTNIQITGLASTSVYFWRVRAKNDCGMSGWSQENSFTTEECTIIMSPNVPFNTVDGFFTTTSLDVLLSGTITDVDVVDFYGDHTYVSDLIIDLSSPDGNGALISLFDGICGTDDNFDLNFDDGAASATIPCPPTTGGTFQPAGSLSDFNGENPNGTWVLRIGDRGPGDVGILRTWGLKICTDQAACGLNVTSNQTSGINSLRNAIDCASPGDIITLSSDIPNAIIDIEDQDLLINKNLTIQADPLDGIILRYSGSQSAIEITNNANVTLNGFTVEQIAAARIKVGDDSKLTKIAMKLKKLK